MGAGSSLPDELSEEMVRQITGPHFDQDMFDTMSLGKGTITRDQLLQAALQKNIETSLRNKKSKSFFSGDGNSSPSRNSTLAQIEVPGGAAEMKSNSIAEMTAADRTAGRYQTDDKESK